MRRRRVTVVQRNRGELLILHVLDSVGNISFQISEPGEDSDVLVQLWDELLESCVLEKWRAFATRVFIRMRCQCGITSSLLDDIMSVVVSPPRKLNLQFSDVTLTRF